MASELVKKWKTALKKTDKSANELHAGTFAADFEEMVEAEEEAEDAEQPNYQALVTMAKDLKVAVGKISKHIDALGKSNDPDDKAAAQVLNKALQPMELAIVRCTKKK